MTDLMDNSPLPAAGGLSTSSALAAGTSSGVRSAAKSGPSAGSSKAARGAGKPAKVSKTKTPDGTNSDHRKEQNRIASRNYREKRKHKLALLKQILDEPSAGEGTSRTVTATASSTPVPAPSNTANGLPNALPDDLAASLAEILPDFQPIVTSLLPSTMMAPAPSLTVAPHLSSVTASLPSSLPSSLPTSLTASALPTTTAEQQPLDDSFAAWAASNLPSAVAANSADKQTSPVSTSTPAAPVASSSATNDVLLDMPMLQPWLIPFSDDQSSFSSYFPPNTLTNADLPPPTFVTPPSSSTTRAAAPGVRVKPHTPSGLSVSETVDIDDAFDPAIDVDHFMAGSDNSQRNNSTDSNLFSDLLSQPNFSTSFYANNFQASFQGNTPPVQTASASPMPAASSTPPNSRQQQQTRTFTTTLPSRPSPIPIFQALATPMDAPVNMDSEPSRQTRKKNKPVVRAMVQYVQTLSAHQKRLILQALLDEDGGTTGSGDDANTGDDDDDRIEEIENAGDDSDSGHCGKSSKNVDERKQTALISRREDRRRQVMARWNSHRYAGEAFENETSQRAFSSASSTYSSSSSSNDPAEAATFARFAVSGFEGMSGLNGLGGPIPLTNPNQNINFGNGRPYYTSSLNIMTLQCRRMGFRAAVLQNCLACGLPNPDVMFDEDCYEESEDMNSPFALDANEARAVVLQGAGRIAAVVAAVRQNLARSGKTPPRDLQPVDAQILVAHHPYIDVIPFRGFRARALALLAEMEAAEEVAAAVSDGLKRNGTSTETPCLLDEDELCYDMNVADGLVCWGSQMGNAGAGLSAQAKRDSDSARDMRSCLPWDMRSWEPQVWFLKKYWFLVGGWDDDMWRNCRWWHSMRGDDLDYSVFASPGY
ncbi:hypothetical protein SEUCBS139899_009132 [Sporothrix eucalyptigena]